MKKSIATALLCAGLTAFLTGCVNTTPKLTPEQQAAQRISTLNVYDDNRIGLISGRDQHRKYSWTTNPRDVLAIDVRGRLYNVKDVVEIKVAYMNGKSTPEAAYVTLKDGTKLVSNVETPLWVRCNAAKRCDKERNMQFAEYWQDLGGILTGAEIRNLKEPGRKDFSDGAFGSINDKQTAMLKDYRAIPDMPDRDENPIVVATGAELAKIDAAVAVAYKAWDEQEVIRDEENRKADGKASKERAAKRAMQDQLLSQARFGTQTMCESARMRGELTTANQLQCNSYGSRSLDELEAAGWNVVNSVRNRAVDDLGNPYSVWVVTVQKVR